MRNRVGDYTWEMTPDELLAVQEENARMAEAEKNYPPTEIERLEALESAILAILGGA